MQGFLRWRKLLTCQARPYCSSTVEEGLHQLTGKHRAPRADHGSSSSSSSSSSISAPRLWAMVRTTTRKGPLVASIKAWRVPACIDSSIEGLPSPRAPVGGFHVYVDRLQAHQYFWSLGHLVFLCTKFQLDIYDKEWEFDAKASQLICSVQAYPQVVNLVGGDEFVNLTFVDPRKWGRRLPILYTGEEQCVGIQKGGFLNRNLTFLAYMCEDDVDMPKIAVDVSCLDIGDSILIKDLNLQYELAPNLSLDTEICSILSREPDEHTSQNESSMWSGSFEDR